MVTVPVFKDMVGVEEGAADEDVVVMVAGAKDVVITVAIFQDMVVIEEVAAFEKWS